MFDSAKEKDLLVTPDHTVRLTTHRLIHDDNGNTKQLMLEDFKKYELEKTNIGHYKFLLIIFSAITVFCIVQAWDDFRYYLSGDYPTSEAIRMILGIFPLNFSIVFLLLSFLFFLLSRRKYVKVTGKYDTIRFRVKSFNHPSMKKFLATIVAESDKRKKELR